MTKRNQRERLFAAMVTASAARGYEAVTIGDLVGLSGVSRADFYEHFADKRDCFIATEKALLERVAGVVALRYDGKGSALRAFTKLVVEQPAAGTLCFVESYAAGPEAVAAMDGMVSSVEALYERAFAARDGATEMPREITRAIVGSLRKLIYTRLRAGRGAELGEIVEEMWEWSSGYEAPPQPLRQPRRRIGEGAEYQPGDPGERIVRATTETVAERGYAAATVAEIATEARVSLSTFYAHFEDKEDAVAAALDAGYGALLGATLPAYRRAKEWPAAVRGALEAIFAFFAAEPAFARLALVETYAASAEAIDQRDKRIAKLTRYLGPGYERSPRTPLLAAEAIGGAIYALVYDHVKAKGPKSLPELVPTATYISLAPFLGAEEACAVANQSGRRERKKGAEIP